MLPSELLERTWVNYFPIKQDENCLVSIFVSRIAWGRSWKEIYGILQTLTGSECPDEWNDSHTKEEVIAVARLAEMKLGLRPIETVVESVNITNLRGYNHEETMEKTINS